MSILTNLLHYYNCDENTGTSLGSTLGTSNKTGTLSGTAGWGGGMVGVGLDFPGYSAPNYGGCQCAAPSGINGANKVSVSLWVSINHTGNYQYGTIAGALFQGSFTSRFEIVGGNTGLPQDIHLSICNGAASNVTVGGVIPTLGEFHHILLVYDGTQATDATKVKLYVDGVQATIPAWGASVPSSLPNNTTYGWYFGRRSDTSGPGKHTLDEIGIWDKALSANEITYMYRVGALGFAFPVVPVIYAPAVTTVNCPVGNTEVVTISGTDGFGEAEYEDLSTWSLSGTDASLFTLNSNTLVDQVLYFNSPATVGTYHVTATLTTPGGSASTNLTINVTAGGSPTSKYLRFNSHF